MPVYGWIFRWKGRYRTWYVEVPLLVAWGTSQSGRCLPVGLSLCLVSHFVIIMSLMSEVFSYHGGATYYWQGIPYVVCRGTLQGRYLHGWKFYRRAVENLFNIYVYIYFTSAKMDYLQLSNPFELVIMHQRVIQPIDVLVSSTRLQTI